MNDFQRWRENGEDYAEGILLWEQYGKSSLTYAYHLEFFKKYNNSFSEKKLFDLLEELEWEKEIPTLAKPIENNPELDIEEYIQGVIDTKKKEYLLAIQARKILINEFRDELKVTGIPMSIKEVCNIMDQVDRNGDPIPFSITWVKYSRTTKEGGELKRASEMILTRPNKTGTKTKRTIKRDGPFLSSKSPNHWKNSSRNIRPLYGMEISKINIWLILEFNGHLVTMDKIA